MARCWWFVVIASFVASAFASESARGVADSSSVMISCEVYAPWNDNQSSNRGPDTHITDRPWADVTVPLQAQGVARDLVRVAADGVARSMCIEPPVWDVGVRCGATSCTAWANPPLVLSPVANDASATDR